MDLHNLMEKLATAYIEFDSACVWPEDYERVREAGFDVHLAKPIDPDLLIRTVCRVLSPRSKETWG